jgi:hypothetical protein
LEQFCISRSTFHCLLYLNPTLTLSNPCLLACYVFASFRAPFAIASSQALQAPAEDRAEVVRELDKSFGNMGTSLDQLIEVMAPLTDPKAKELVGLFKQLKNPNATPKPSKPAEDDLLGI